jgi:hypothetical protein
LTKNSDDRAVYVEAEFKPHTWKYLHTPGPSSENLPDDPRERAKALFHLINPMESSYWPAYIRHRQEADKIMDDKMEDMTGEDVDTFLGHVKDELECALTGVLEEPQWKAVADGVIVMGADVSGDGFGEVRRSIQRGSPRKFLKELLERSAMQMSSHAFIPHTSHSLWMSTSCITIERGGHLSNGLTLWVIALIRPLLHH